MFGIFINSKEDLRTEEKWKNEECHQLMLMLSEIDTSPSLLEDLINSTEFKTDRQENLYFYEYQEELLEQGV